MAAIDDWVDEAADVENERPGLVFSDAKYSATVDDLGGLSITPSPLPRGLVGQLITWLSATYQ